MGQKVHPHGFRLGYIYDWNSKWFADRNYTELLHEDLQIRRAIEKMLPDAGICRVEIERNANQITGTIHTAPRPPPIPPAPASSRGVAASASTSCEAGSRRSAAAAFASTSTRYAFRKWRR